MNVRRRRTRSRRTARLWTSRPAFRGSRPEPCIDLGYLRLGGLELAVLSLPLGDARALRVLSEAEREVCRQVLLGRSNEEIARSRGSSARTVANQVAAIFGKLGVSSRAELALLCLAPTRR